MSNSTAQNKSSLFSVVELPLFIIVNICICLKIYRKFQNNVDPVHIFILNYFGTQALKLFSHDLIHVFIILSRNHENCNEYLFSLFASLSWYFGIISMNMDRFVAIFWDIHYKERVTTSRSIGVCICSMVTAGSLTCLARMMDDHYSTCSSQEIIVNTRITNILLEGVTKLLVAVITVTVSFYVVIKKTLGLNTVVPRFTKPVFTVSRVAGEERTTQTRRLDIEPSMFYKVESNVVQKTTKSGDDQRNEAWLPRGSIIGMKKTGTGLKITGSLYQNETQGIEEQPITDLNETEFYLMVKKTTTMTILTILQLSAFLPSVILSMVYNNCSMDSGDCDSFIGLNRMFTPFRILFFLVQSGVVIKRLMQND